MLNTLVKYIVNLTQHLVSYKICLVIENKKNLHQIIDTTLNSNIGIYIKIGDKGKL